MQYANSNHFEHQQSDRVGVLITNLGTPEAPTRKALKAYLREFLSDPRVVEVPRLVWWCVLHGFILNFRPSRSAKAYARIWRSDGSPLMIHTRELAAALRLCLTKEYGDRLLLEFAMRYGQPSIDSAINSLLQRGARKLLILPLYPQYSATTTASTFDAVARELTSRRWLPDLRFISHYHDYPAYIEALCESIHEHWKDHQPAEKLLFSYHGLPRRYLDKGDPYFCECHKTTRLVAEKLGLEAEQYLTVFQSRFGREEWLQPYCDVTLQQLATQGVKSVQLICPGFSADCLETEDEIGIENRDLFHQAGGERYEYIGALNSRPAHIETLAQLISDNLNCWLDDKAGTEGRAGRAVALGANK